MGHDLKKRIAAPALGVIFTVVGAGLGLAQAQQPPESAQNPAKSALLRDLQSLDELRGAFNRDTGRIRLILLLSPT